MWGLFAHGLGRSPLSGWPLLRHLRQNGLPCETFAYFAAVESFSAIRSRLVRRLTVLAAQGDDYVLIGHSLGGVLLRAALAELPLGTCLPRHLFLIASPVRPSRLAIRLSSNLLFRAATGDCGQLLGSVERMAALPPCSVPCTAIVGIRSLPWLSSVFGEELNDGVVALSEVSTDWIERQERLGQIHTLLPASKQAAEIILRTVL